MLEKNDQEYLFGALRSGRVNLFLGAGFSIEATNYNGTKIPTGWGLINILWSESGLPGNPTETDKLTDMFDHAIKKLGIKKVDEILKLNLEAKQIPAWMSIISQFHWRTIYTTNIDNVVRKIYREKNCVQALQEIDGTLQDLKDRDTSFLNLNCIQLHGNLQTPPDRLTFGLKQYAGRINTKYDPWYTELTSEYCNSPMIFIGSQLEEPVFWQYVESRGAKRPGLTNPKSFLIAKSISPLKQKSLESDGVVPIETTAEGFLKWLDDSLSEKPTRRQIITIAAPHLLLSLDQEEKNLKPIVAKSLREFLAMFSVFAPVKKDSGHLRTTFLQGAIPTIQDIAHDLDAPRDLTTQLKDLIADTTKDKSNLTIVYGQSGSGKSTIARRLAWDLSAAGNFVLFNESGHFPNLNCVTHAIETFGVKPIVIVDDCHKSNWDAVRFAEKLLSLDAGAQIIYFARANSSSTIIDQLSKLFKINELPMPDLSQDEIVSLLGVLEKSGLLGRLLGLSHDKRIYEFEVRAKKQILVAMKEATAGKAFGEIIKDDFNTISSQEAKQLYALTSLFTSHGHATPRNILIGAFGQEPSLSMNLIRRDLRGLVIDVGNTGERFIARHQIIAEHIISHVVNRSQLFEIYTEALTKMAILAKNASDPKSRYNKLYKTLLRHDVLHRRFGKDNVALVRSIYDSVQQYSLKDYHYWLQYSNFELTIGNSELAETYINSAISILDSSGKSDNYVALTSVKISLHKALFEVDTKSEAVHLRDSSLAKLDDIINTSGSKNAYSYHVYALALKMWAQQRESTAEEKMSLIKNARRIVAAGLKQHPRNQVLTALDESLREGEYVVAGGLDWVISDNDVEEFLSN